MSAFQTARAAECQRVLRENPSALPVAVECSSGRVHFLAVPRDATVADLEAAVHAALGDKKLALAIAGCSPAATTAVADLHAAYGNADGMLHVAVRAETSMGDGFWQSLPCAALCPSS
ncbi:ATG8/AUT7/APG8/PAZ2 [Novymonas esmeraldas]|uniref:ATG8/AUT7/APG8/PAZ2 n=1 Tax=Novymonas esmeraldas TaxID=1808958 RepID=A0AAW0F1T5_9TRYP